MNQIKPTQLLLCLCAMMALFSCQNENAPAVKKAEMIEFKNEKITYPTTQKDEVVDDYHGTQVADPYRWLEDDVSPETEAWVKAQNEVTFNYLDNIPYRDAIKDRLTKVWNFERMGSPFKAGDSYYYFKNNGLQNQSVMYRVADLANKGKAEMVLDPNTFSEDGTTALGSISFSKDGSKLAYQISEGGSDWRTILVKDMATGKMLEDKINWVKFSGIAWKGDGFYYSRYPEPTEGDALKGANQFQKVYYHKLGTDQSADEIVFSDNANPNRGFAAGTSDDERFLIISIWESTSGNALYVKDLDRTGSDFVELQKEIEKDYNIIDNVGDDLIVLTNAEASNSRLFKINMNKPERSAWQELIPNGKFRIKSASVIQDKIFLTYLEDAKSVVKIFDMNGKFIQDLALPGIGTTGGFSWKKGETSAFYSFGSYTRPSSIYQLDLSTMKSALWFAPTVDFASDDYTTEQIWYESKDGTRVPMFITHKKGLAKDGKRPTLLYGYGGFDISLEPGFSVSKTAILENGGVYVVANLRGGGEFGEEWHLAGTKERKQNVFDDFIAAGEKLIELGYTSSDYLAIEGGSNGGLLVGACMPQRPDLFKVAFPRVGVLDMLRYHEFTIGRAWKGDYGLSEDPEAFKYLMAYSPLHNVKDVEYPATMVMTADHDDRVVPAHSFKFAAELQAHQQGTNPALIRIDTNAGHGAGKSTEKMIQEAADAAAFMFYNMTVVVGDK